MDPRSAERLELPAVRGRLVALTSFAGGARRAAALRPSPDPDRVAELSVETTEALALREAGVGGPAGAHDTRELTLAAARGEVLDIEALESVAVTVAVAVETVEDIEKVRDRAPMLAQALEVVPLGPLRGLGASLTSALDHHGGLLDNASPGLRRARSALRRARREAAETLRRLANQLGSHLSEGFVTERAGRSVLAVKASSRSAVPGIVHGTSSSGQTLFVEPLGAVDAGNRVRELESAEAAEVERILVRLTGRVAQEAPGLDASVEALASLDLALARAALSASWSGCPVARSEAPVLLGARHPLLDPGSAVPIDIDLSGISVLVVSGPNAGGKTVALKTLGLFAQLHQCGLRLPARRAALPVYRRIVAEIGDDQSIELSLSTFSSRVRQLAQILRDAGPGVLILLDEIAAGTDPVEGAALATAILSSLADRGATTLATTHHSDLKEWAAASPVAANAAVAVDPSSFEPRYELIAGEPGASHALEIAERLGIDPEVVDRARLGVDPARRQAERLLSEASAARSGADEARVRAEAEAERAASATRRAERREREAQQALEEIRARAEVEREGARRAARAELADAERELSDLRGAIADARREEVARGGAAAPEIEMERVRERDRRLGAASAARERARAALRDPAEAARAAVVGSQVIDATLGFRGEVVAVRGSHAEVQGPGARMRLPLDRLVVVVDGPPAEPEMLRSPRSAAVPPPPAPLEIDLRGERVEPVRDAVRRAVDGAGAAGLPQVRIIHGHGTGALRAVVREELAGHPMVERAEPAPPDAGGDGVTIAFLDEEVVSE